MKIDVAYGKNGLTVEVPDENLTDVLRMTEKPVIEDPVGVTREKLASPIGSKSLAELARGKKTACIVICDITRPVPNTVIVPPIIEVLEREGIKSGDITILIATGIHRPNEGEELTTLLGEDIPKKYRVVNHMSRDLDSQKHRLQKDGQHPRKLHGGNQPGPEPHHAVPGHDGAHHGAEGH